VFSLFLVRAVVGTARGWLIDVCFFFAWQIKLYFANKQFPLRLGVLMTVWTMFVSDAPTTDSAVVQGVHAYANLFPGKVTSDHIMVHEGSEATNGVCRGPLGYQNGEPLAGLSMSLFSLIRQILTFPSAVTLASYITSGYDGVVGAKILVCVKSIGAKKSIVNKTGGESDLVEVWLFDHTGEIRWSVWNDLIDSAKEWHPGKTILLISNPGFKAGCPGKGSLGIIKDTFVDIDPEFPDAEWLSKYAERRTKKESMRQEFPEGMWDMEAAEYGANVILFTLAGLDEWQV